GYTSFDHADIYGDGACEELFGEVLRESPQLREQVLIASKCGIRFAGDPDADSPTRYDFSQQHIVASVDGSLRRLGIEQLDLLLLHRPDYLMRTDAVAEAFASLKSSGKVAQFGVSNFSASQFNLLQSVLPDPLLVNQIEINIHNIDALSNGVLEQCQQLGITPQAWCPIAGIAYPAWGNTFSDKDEARIRAEVQWQSEKYGAEDWIIALAWLLRHPAMISPIVGSTNPSRIAAATSALEIPYDRKDWYRLFEARNGQPVP
ncbi:MAG: aldo/keto reductase, partial [Gammaproteobacteria bacterium]|nr:aldo/keto reductase [Gammaproteobacteria bacterium]